MPLEYALANCDPIIIDLMLKFQARSKPDDMIKLAICRGDVQILALVLVNLIENKLLSVNQDDT